MLPLFDAAGDLATETLVFANELRTNESLSLEHVREISGCARLPRRGDETSASASSDVYSRTQSRGCQPFIQI